MASSSGTKKVKGLEKVYVRDEDSNDDLIDFSFLDFALETFKPTSNMSDDPFLNILCDENMLRRTVDGMGDDDQEVGVKDPEHDHIDDQNDSEVGVEYGVRDPDIHWKQIKSVVGECYESPSQLRSNPGRTCKVGVDSNAGGMNYFKRFYVCLKAFKDGWSRGCRHVIGLDACFLKVANLDLDCGRGLVVISDQHKGLLQALTELLPYVEHRQCARHIYANFRKKYTGLELKNLFWEAAKSTVEGDFIATNEENQTHNSQWL
uniref:MULE transposase domain-containing protein n=1 Tax=Lactuca sativa TaxID=4236 RepID=A0A9R1VW22_LACSA|nr:hypothetical protein LSAT_V11C400205570 [Lactuca sativa]